MSLFYKTINIMGKFIKVSRDDLYNKVRQSLSGYEVSGDTQNRLMTSVFHLVSYMEKEHLSDYTPDVGISYLSTINVDKGIAYRHYQRDKRAIVMLDSIISGDADSFFRKQRVPVKRLFRGEFAKHVKSYIENVLPSKGLAKSTEDSYHMYLSRFCEETYSKKLSPSTITRSDLNAYISRITTARRYFEALPVKYFLKYLHEEGLVDDSISTCLDGIQNRRYVPLVSYFEEDEIRRMEGCIARSSSLGKRNYAMFLLASRLGLRRFDVVNMKLSNIDWDRNEISLVQQKTQNGIVLPLTAVVGEALVDYLTNGRPKSTSSFVFLSETKRDRPVTEHTFTTLVSDCMRDAGIDIRERHHGPHSLRHSLATHLMKKKIKMPVIKDILGHTTTEPTYAYLAIDHDSLLLCSMDVPKVRGVIYSQKGGMI